jgi:hypothetical protein
MLNSVNNCYLSFLALVSTCLVSKHIKIKIYKTVIVPVVLCGWEMRDFIVREGYRVGVFKNRVLGKIL